VWRNEILRNSPTHAGTDTDGRSMSTMMTTVVSEPGEKLKIIKREIPSITYTFCSSSNCQSRFSHSLRPARVVIQHLEISHPTKKNIHKIITHYPIRYIFKCTDARNSSFNQSFPIPVLRWFIFNIHSH
jgi:hypothetical protein